MIEVLLSERIRKTAERLPPELREKASRAIAEVAAAFGDPHQHRGLGLRKLGSRSYEIRVHLQWRVVFARGQVETRRDRRFENRMGRRLDLL